MAQKEKLTINAEYLQGLNQHTLYQQLDHDLSLLKKEGIVELHRPPYHLSSLYPDAVSYICGKSIEGSFVLKPNSQHDVDRIKAVLGYRHVVGDRENGYRFRRAA